MSTRDSNPAYKYWPTLIFISYPPIWLLELIYREIVKQQSTRHWLTSNRSSRAQSFNDVSSIGAQ